MAPRTIPFPSEPAARARLRAQDAHHLALNAEDGTLHLLRSGFLVAGVAGLCAFLTLFVLGGIGPDGPPTNLGWITLMVALMSMPFGLILLLLGGAKWLRNAWLSRAAPTRQ